MFKGFRDFVMRGNVIELAVAVVIAGAFGAVITSFVGDILTPLLGLLGVPDFSTASITVGDAEVRYGAFLNALIALRDFLYETVYERPEIRYEFERAQRIITELWEHFHGHLDEFRERHWPKGIPETERAKTPWSTSTWAQPLAWGMASPLPIPVEPCVSRLWTRRSIFFASTSKQKTLLPASARQAPVTRPT